MPSSPTVPTPTAQCSPAPQQQNIFVWTLAVNKIKQVSHLHGEISTPQWSPDGKSIAFLFVENATRRAGALDAMKPWSGVIGEDGVELQRVAAVQPDQDDFFYLSPPSLHVYEFTWDPVHLKIAFVAAPPPGENNWWVAQLYLRRCPDTHDRALYARQGLSSIDPHLRSHHHLRPAPQPPDRRPPLLPRRQTNRLHRRPQSDQGSIGGDIYLIPSTGLAPGQQPKNITPNRPSTPAYIAWLDDHDIGISEHVGGSSRITTLDLTTGHDVPGLAVTFPESIIAGSDVMSVSIASPLPQHRPHPRVLRPSA